MVLSNPSDWDNSAAGYSKLAIEAPIYVPCTKMLDDMNNTLPFSTASAVLDIGCGPGTVADLLFKTYGHLIPDSTRLIASDFSNGMVEATRMKREKEVLSKNKDVAKCWSRLEIDVMDAQNLEKISSSSMSHVIGSLVYFLLPESRKGLAEAHRVLSEDGVFACTSWSKVGWMEFLVQAASEVHKDTKPSVSSCTWKVEDADANKIDQLDWPDIWKTTEGVKGEMEAVGFQNVKAEYVEVDWHVPDPKQFVNNFARNKNPATAAVVGHLNGEELDRCCDNWVRIVEENGNVCKGIAILGIGRK